MAEALYRMCVFGGFERPLCSQWKYIILVRFPLSSFWHDTIAPRPACMHSALTTEEGTFIVLPLVEVVTPGRDMDLSPLRSVQPEARTLLSHMKSDFSSELSLFTWATSDTFPHGSSSIHRAGLGHGPHFTPNKPDRRLQRRSSDAIRRDQQIWTQQRSGSGHRPWNSLLSYHN
jgi:hypothetical protein